ncbi:MAG: hypothetical protein KDN18_10370 [Verrucomicrobiae bacterium]|nr:hypothetical protein [Verrucomicrobiae bacterium]
MKRKKRFLILLVAGTIVVGLVVILVSLVANGKRWDRETALSVAQHDGQSLLSKLSGSPFEAIDYPQMESGPLAPDLSNADEAWIVWKQDFSAGSEFPSVIAWYRERLPAGEWNESGESPDKTSFRNGEWTVTLESIPQSAPSRFSREIKWTRNPEIL